VLLVIACDPADHEGGFIWMAARTSDEGEAQVLLAQHFITAILGSSEQPAPAGSLQAGRTR
jgi:hypothetical protein